MGWEWGGSGVGCGGVGWRVGVEKGWMGVWVYGCEDVGTVRCKVGVEE